ncbi:MAG: hypothetical protein R3B06_12725 [Kofleriaceae bacterium]
MTPRIVRLGGAALVPALIAACGGGGEPATIDATVDTSSIDAAPAAPVTFRLSYQSDVPDSIFVQAGTEVGGQGWLAVLAPGGDMLTILDSCGLCDCAACGQCPVCGIGQPVVTELPRGASIDWTWDARVFTAGTCAASSMACETAATLAPGAYVARFCWSATSDGVGPGHHVGPLQCADEPFVYPPPAGPVVPVEHVECACG